MSGSGTPVAVHRSVVLLPAITVVVPVMEAVGTVGSVVKQQIIL